MQYRRSRSRPGDDVVANIQLQFVEICFIKLVCVWIRWLIGTIRIYWAVSSAYTSCVLTSNDQVNRKSLADSHFLHKYTMCPLYLTTCMTLENIISQVICLCISSLLRQSLIENVLFYTKWMKGAVAFVSQHLPRLQGWTSIRNISFVFPFFFVVLSMHVS